MSIERWKTFSKHDQLLNIGSAIKRASNWQKQDPQKFSMAVDEALALLGLTLEDPKWTEYRFALEYLRSQIEKFKHGERKENIEILYRAL